MSLHLVPVGEEADCPVQLEPYENAVVLECGHSFSEAAVRELRDRCCPKCRKPITRDPVPNYALRAIMETRGTPTAAVYELFCVDVSTSMWYSDFIGPLAVFVGESRLKIAQEFCNKIAGARQNDPSHRMGLMAFGSNVSLRCEFATPADFRAEVAKLEPVESRTRIFDAFQEAISHLQAKTEQLQCQCRLYMLTDGGENFSKRENAAELSTKLGFIVNTAKKLKVTTVVFNVGGDVNSTRKVADTLHATFKDINSKNVSQMANDLCVVEFPNRAREIRNILTGTKFAREQQVHQLLGNAPPVPMNRILPEQEMMLVRQPVAI